MKPVDIIISWIKKTTHRIRGNDLNSHLKHYGVTIEELRIALAKENLVLLDEVDGFKIPECTHHTLTNLEDL